MIIQTNLAESQLQSLRESFVVALGHGFDFASFGGDVQFGFRCLFPNVFAFFGSDVASVEMDVFFFSVEHLRSAVDVRFVRGGGRKAVHGARFGVAADVRFHPEIPLVAFFGLVHLGAPLAALVLGRGRRGDDGRVHHGA